MKKFILLLLAFLISTLTIINISCSELENFDKDQQEILSNAFQKAGNNVDEIKKFVEECPAEYDEGMFFLLENMPERDLKNLSTELLLTNLSYSYRVMDKIKWGEKIPKEIFLNYILPYANLHERRDNWRQEFYSRFLPFVENLNSPSEAVLILNKIIWDSVNVHYSTKRPKADQSPYESIDTGLASCTGLSILLIDVCRAVGVPARFVGVPLWKDHSGNHSWVEIWDDGWHFIGAEEVSPLDETWFGERAKLSDDSDWKYSIYANSFKKTDVIFPPLFDSTATYVYAEIVTERYSEQIENDGLVNVGIRLFDEKNGKRISGKINVIDQNKIVKSGETKNEKNDYNDFLIFRLSPNKKYIVEAEYEGSTIKVDLNLGDKKYQFKNVYLK